MKKLLLLSVCIAFGLVLKAQVEYKLINSNVQIAGTSTLHDWTADVTKTTGYATLSVVNGALTNIHDVSITMDARTIKSEKGSAMDKNIYKALNTERYPSISFVLTKLTPVSVNKLNAVGKLTIAGTTQSISLTVYTKTNGHGDMVFTGSKALKMTDFRIEPPVVLLGTLKTGNDITISFETTFAPVVDLSQK